MASSSNQMPMQSSSHDLLPTYAAKPEATKAVRSELPLVPWDALKNQTKRGKTVKITEERPTWLPDGWRMEVKGRTSSKREGYRDRENHLRLDIKNCPAKVSWVLSNFVKGLWTPYINNEEVLDSTKNLWVATMEDIINDANTLRD